MIIFTKIVILICLGYIVGAGIQWLRDRTHKVKYYTLESNDGEIYMTYSTLRQALAECKDYAYSGVCRKHIVGGKRSEVQFIW